MKLTWFIANRLGGDGGESRFTGVGNTIAIVSVAISIVVIILALAISNGFREEIKSKASAFEGDLIISPVEYYNDSQVDISDLIIDTLRSVSEIENLDFVKSISGISYRPGMIKNGDQLQAIILQGVDSTFNFDFYRNALTAGALPNLNSQSPQILISKRLADMLFLEIGDPIQIYFFVDNNVRIRKFNLSGIYSAQFEDLDKIYVITSKKVVNQINGWRENSSTLYMIDYHNHSDKFIEGRKRMISQIIYDKMTEDDPPVTLLSLKDKLYKLYDWLNLLDLNVLVILILMIAVAGFNIISSILIILFENISKIGLLKSLGMSQKGIRNVFLVKGAKIVSYGILLGNIMGITLAIVQKYFRLFKLDPQSYFIDYVPIRLSVVDVLLVDLVCFVAILFIVLIPCFFIGKISPAQTLRVT